MAQINLKHRRRVVQNVVEEVLDLLNKYEWSAGGGVFTGGDRESFGGHNPRTNPQYFDGATPILRTELFDNPADVIDITTSLTDLRHSLDLRLVVPSDDESGPIFVRVTQRTVKEVRGRVRLLMPIMVEYGKATGTTGRARRYIAQTGIYGQRRDGAWLPLFQGASNGYAPSDELKRLMQIAPGWALLQEHQWRVYFREEGTTGLGITLPTDATGAQGVFRFRELPPGAKRRTALLHWVEEHWRQDRVDPMLERKVRTYLKSKGEFNWNGLICRITPSLHEEQLEEVAKEERQQEHEEGQDVRSLFEPSLPITRPWWHQLLMRLRSGKQ